MAFVSQADRGIIQISKSIDTIGPGSYNIDHPKQNTYSCAPFWSTSTRRNSSEGKVPGPGAYSSANLGWPHTITTYSNSNNIIIKLNTLGTTPFQSKIVRFPQNNEETPGPADYEAERQQSHQQKRPRLKSNKLFNTIPNAPSITKVNYLSERRTKTEHSPLVDLHKKKGVLAGVWGKDKCKRFNSKFITEVGPGSYELPMKLNATKKGLSGSNPFLSNTVRTFDTIVYQARNAETLALRKMENYHSEQPAPGSYNLSTVKHAAALQYKNHTFGSTLQRFGRSKTEESAPFYEIGSSFQTQHFRKKSVPFNSQSKKMADKSEQIPGPGYYSVNNQQNFMTRRYIQCFGSTVKRSLDQPLRNQKVGPGCYQPNFKRATQVQQTSVFASKQARFFQVTPKADKKFAAYELEKDDISQRVMEQRLHRQNLQKINCAKPAFDKQTPRFAHYEQAEEQPKKMTVQQLEHLMRQRKEEERNKGIEAAREQTKTQGGAMPRGERFKEKKGGPGVGDYALRNKWTKKSYNIKYSLGQ